MVSAAIVVELLPVIIWKVPVPIITTDMFVELAVAIKLLTYTVVAGILPPKVEALKVLNLLLAVIVGIAISSPIVRLGALVEVPPVVPNVNVLVTDVTASNPPVPVQVNPVAFAIDKFV